MVTASTLHTQTPHPPSGSDSAPEALDLAIRSTVEAVPDPEMPPVTIGDLGMVMSVEIDGDTAIVEVMPTFSGCPAIPYMEVDIIEAARRAGAGEVRVRWRRDSSWGPELITEEGKAKLREAGIAPPGSGQVLSWTPSTLVGIGGVKCPYCGSRNTRADSPFGSAPCRSTHSCRDCKTPFDAIKPI